MTTGGTIRNGATSGTLTLTAPTRPGQYEFRYLSDDSFLDLARSRPVTVRGADSAEERTRSSASVRTYARSRYAERATSTDLVAGNGAKPDGALFRESTGSSRQDQPMVVRFAPRTCGRLTPIALLEPALFSFRDAVLDRACERKGDGRHV